MTFVKILTHITTIFALFFLVYIIIWFIMSTYNKYLELYPLMGISFVLITASILRLIFDFNGTTIFNFIIWTYNVGYWYIICKNQRSNKVLYNYFFKKDESNIN